MYFHSVLKGLTTKRYSRVLLVYKERTTYFLSMDQALL